MSSEKEEEVVITFEDKHSTTSKKQSSSTFSFSGSTTAVKEVKKPDNVNVFKEGRRSCNHFRRQTFY